MAMPSNEITVHDCATGETIVREMTDNEKAIQKQIIADQKTASEANAKKQADRESARAKLTALGLTDDEITALIP
jgi:Holliday junction resolvasome RuvABC DNA-binding subunit